MEKLKIAEIEKATGGRVKVRGNISEITDIVTDTRVEAGEASLFVPLKGENFDGRDFIDKFTGGAVLEVEDGNKALADLARYYRGKFDIPVIGITGSVGKTSTKEMMAGALSGQFKVLKTEGNFNNEVGLPKTIFRLDSGVEAAVFEMGMNHAGEMSRLSAMGQPSVAVITNIGTAHIGNLGSREGILGAKMEIIDSLQEGGLVVLNADDDLLWPQVAKLPHRVVTYGIRNEEADIRGTILDEKSDSSEFEVEGVRAVVNMAGEHVVYNALASIAVGKELGVPLDVLLRGIAGVSSEHSGRQNVRKLDGFTLIDDCYNACLDSMEASLKVLAKVAGEEGRRLAVLGDMFELGTFAEEYHTKVGQIAREVGAELLITIGKDANLYMNGDIKAESIEEAYLAVKENVRKGDTLLIKASNGMGLKKLVQKLEGAE